MGAPSDGGLLAVDLPEHGQLTLPLAGLGARMVAAWIDATLALGTAVGLLGLGAYLVHDVLPADPGLLAGAAVAAFTLVPVAAPLGFELWGRGRSPGKSLLRLRVLSADGSRASAGQLALRNVLRLVDFLPLGYVLGLVVAFASPRGQRLGDLVAGTLVIREDAGALTELSGPPAPPREARGLPSTLVRAAQLLDAPGRGLDPSTYQQRRAEVLAMARRDRPDLAGETDDELWARLRGGVGLE